MTRRLSTQDLVVVCLLGCFVILCLSALTEIAVLHAIFAALIFCGLIALYGRLVPPDEPASYASRSASRDRDMSLRQQARIMDGFAEAVIMINHQERILYANESARQLLSIKDLGGLFSGLIRDPDVGQLVTDILAGKVPDPVIYTTDMPVERHIRVVGSPLAPEKDTDGIKRAIIVFYEITDLVLSNTMRADFLANASHELKTPIASLLGYIETLRGHAREDTQARETFLEIMQKQAERMQRLIDDLLSLRRIELVEHLEPDETADLFLATRAAIESVTPLAKSRHIKLKYIGPKSVPVTGVQDELVQVILNLLDNAVSVTSSHDAITLSVDLLPHWTPGQMFSSDPLFEHAARRRIVVPKNISGSYARLRVRDPGPGFARDHIPRLGERFYKIEGRENRGHKGTGLGLAIVKHIMLRHRGGLLIESAEGVGTEFTLIFPTPQS